MTDLVVVSLEAWDDVWRRNQYLISGLLDTDPTLRVLFVEPPDDPLHTLRAGGRPRFGHRPQAVQDRLWTFRGAKALPRRIDPAADTRLANATRKAAQRLGMSAPLLWINDPAAVEIAQQTGWPTLYDMTDDWLAADRPAAERTRLNEGEQWLFAHARAVVACSPELVRRKSRYRDDITLIRNAVDVERYRRPTARPTDAPSGPYALYVGTLHRDRLDVELCLTVARTLRNQMTLVFVGPDALPARDSAALREAGAWVLGARESTTVPAYLQHADVLVVPHLVTAFTDSLDPLKLHEYQATGRPVVSTPVAGFRDAHDARFCVVESSAFAAAVATVGDASWPFPQRAQTAGDDWHARVDQARVALSALSRDS